MVICDRIDSGRMERKKMPRMRRKMRRRSCERERTKRPFFKINQKAKFGRGKKVFIAIME